MILQNILWLPPMAQIIQLDEKEMVPAEFTGNEKH